VWRVRTLIADALQLLRRGKPKPNGVS